MSILTANIKEASYGKKIILPEINLSFNKCEITTLIGPNGAGKSTFLKVLMGMVKTKLADITLNNCNISNLSIEEKVRSGMNFIPQGNRVFSELTVKENLEVGGYIIKLKINLNERIEYVLELFPALKEFLNKNAGKLSGGEKQQLALARALILNPKVLLLDEPSLGLSPKLVRDSFDIIKKINSELNVTIIIVEQKVREVLKISDRIIAMKNGVIALDKLPQKMTEKDLSFIFLN
jgi:branched-chain amino acid transport system ATP-binding protein